jgi:DNA primase
MRAALAKAQGLADMLWAGETEGQDHSTPERRAGLEADLERLVKTIRDPKIADYYRRDFSDRVFKAFKQRQPYQGKPRSEGRRRDFRPNFGRPAPPAQDVSAAVKRSLLVMNALSGAKSMIERRLIALLICSPELIERYSEALAWLSLDDAQLDRIRGELINLAASGKRLDKAAVENHLHGRGFSALVEGLKTHSVHQSDFRGHADEEAREALWLRTRAQLADPDTLGPGDLKDRRDRALQRYMDGGASKDWDELQRLNGEIRSSAEADGKRDGK